MNHNCVRREYGEPLAYDCARHESWIQLRLPPLVDVGGIYHAREQPDQMGRLDSGYTYFAPSVAKSGSDGWEVWEYIGARAHVAVRHDRTMDFYGFGLDLVRAEP